jgi:uncharacterized protein with GYD domain
VAGYIQFHKYTQQGVSDIKGSPDRIAAARTVAAQAGIKIVGVWLTMGQYDLVAIFDAPDDQTMATFTLALARVGNVTTTTARAFSEDEFAQIAGKLP